jgi:hypothetical protein
LTSTYPRLVSAAVGSGTFLAPAEWRAKAEVHRERVLPWVRPRLARRSAGQSHPVDDFLFTYYSYRPAQLLTWHPGLGVTCQLDDEQVPTAFTGRGYQRSPAGVGIEPTAFTGRLSTAAWVQRLLAATADRTPSFGCFGLHEWAMVYRVPQDQVRHATWPLRLPPDQVADVVEVVGPRCTHFDAFRFFTDAARPLNSRTLTRADQLTSEQPGCLHATMDLYKWAYKLSPLTPSDLVADCFELARDVRTVDMQASPYDLSDLGFEPIAIETPEGRVEYVERQREFTARAEPLRDRLLVAARAIHRKLEDPLAPTRHTSPISAS